MSRNIVHDNRTIAAVHILLYTNTDLDGTHLCFCTVNFFSDNKQQFFTFRTHTEGLVTMIAEDREIQVHTE